MLCGAGPEQTNVSLGSISSKQASQRDAVGAGAGAGARDAVGASAGAGAAGGGTLNPDSEYSVSVHCTNQGWGKGALTGRASGIRHSWSEC